MPAVELFNPTCTPLSLAQQRLWVLARMEGPSETFNMVRAFRLEGPLDLPALETRLLHRARIKLSQPDPIVAGRNYREKRHRRNQNG